MEDAFVALAIHSPDTGIPKDLTGSISDKAFKAIYKRCDRTQHIQDVKEEDMEKKLVPLLTTGYPAVLSTRSEGGNG